MPFSESLKKKIRKRANFRCCMCRTVGVDIHHIVPQADGGEDTEDNAAPLCPNCHSTYGANPEKQKMIREMRNDWYERCMESPMTASKTETKSESIEKNVINFPKGINKGIVVNKIDKVNIKTQNTRIKTNPPEGSIASSLNHRNYIKRLIDRYHELKKADVGNKKMIYPILYRSINRKFGARWEMVPIEKFDCLSEYLQQRIDKTILGKTQKSKGQKNYSTFLEYCDKHGR